MTITTVGLDLAKNIFQVHAVYSTGRVVAGQALRRSQVLSFFAKLVPGVIGMEARRTPACSMARMCSPGLDAPPAAGDKAVAGVGH